MEWRDISSAPRDGTEILVWGKDQSDVYFACFYGGWWVADVHPYEWTELIAPPTHWMSLPQPPEPNK